MEAHVENEQLAKPSAGSEQLNQPHVEQEQLAKPTQTTENI